MNRFYRSHRSFGLRCLDQFRRPAQGATRHARAARKVTPSPHRNYFALAERKFVSPFRHATISEISRSCRNQTKDMTVMEHLPIRLTRADASSYLRDRHGISRTAGTLAKLAVIGGGPSFRRVGSRGVIYDVTELDRWAESLLSEPLTSTSAAA
jgi:hypothetical protein